jgi:hypothetical protein
MPPLHAGMYASGNGAQHTGMYASACCFPVTVFRHCLQVLLRKGGIREPTFTPKAQQFLLFPTVFHSEAQLLKPGIAERYQQVCGPYVRQLCQS